VCIQYPTITEVSEINLLFVWELGLATNYFTAIVVYVMCVLGVTGRLGFVGVADRHYEKKLAIYVPGMKTCSLSKMLRLVEVFRIWNEKELYRNRLLYNVYVPKCIFNNCDTPRSSKTSCVSKLAAIALKVGKTGRRWCLLAFFYSKVTLYMK
jgi:hypothetical protein